MKKKSVFFSKWKRWKQHQKRRMFSQVTQSSVSWQRFGKDLESWRATINTSNTSSSYWNDFPSCTWCKFTTTFEQKTMEQKQIFFCPLLHFVVGTSRITTQTLFWDIVVLRHCCFCLSSKFSRQRHIFCHVRWKLAASCLVLVIRCLDADHTHTR